MDKHLKTGGKKNLDSASIALPGQKLATSKKPRMLTPSEIVLLIMSLGRRYVQYINRTYKRTGTLWDSRYKSSVIQADTYLLTCQRYIELNPVRAAMDR